MLLDSPCFIVLLTHSAYTTPLLFLLFYSFLSPPPTPPSRVLKKLPYPMTLTMAQFTVISVVMPLLMQVWNKRRRTFTRKQYMSGMVPLACLKLFSSLSGFMTLLKVPVSYAHTVKVRGGSAPWMYRTAPVDTHLFLLPPFPLLSALTRKTFLSVSSCVFIANSQLHSNIRTTAFVY